VPVCQDAGVEEPPADLARRLERLLGAAPVRWRQTRGGYTAAERWVVGLAGGRSAFAKLATNANTTGWIRREWLVYERLRGPFLPGVLAYEDGDRPLLVLEDLSAGHWPPPWPKGLPARVLRTLGEVAATPPPAGLPPLPSIFADSPGWQAVAADRAAFLAVGACGAAWLARALPALLDAAARAPLAGPSLVHGDVRSDNLCLAGDRVVLVDWNWASVGNPVFDVAAWLPSLHAEGGPPPWEVLPGEPELATWLAGYLAAGSMPGAGWASARVPALRRRLLASALPWAARALGLPPPA
jgi:hypothetical protein